MKKFLHSLFYIIPSIIWLYIFHEFYDQGQLNLSMDTKDFYLYTNYFLNHIQRGVYPFWNPFGSWGRPDDLMALMIGAFNPFLYMIVLLKNLGLGFSLAYFLYLITYFFLGIAGVVFLAKQVFRNPLIVWVVFISTLFSNLGSNVFFSILVILIFVPTVWFFYFLISFAERPQKSSFLGAVFCTMIILTTYMPFHFIILFFTFLIPYACLYTKALIEAIGRCWMFISKNLILVTFCFFSLFLSIIPGWLWYRSSLKGTLIASWRGENDPLGIAKEMVNSGSIISMHTLQNLISNLQDYVLGTFYMPCIFILVGLISFILPLNRRRMLFFTMGLFLFMLCMLEAFPVHAFLYKHVPFLKYIRNIHFLFWGFGLVLIFFIADLWEGLIDLRRNTIPKRIGLCALVIVLHGATYFFLSKAWAIIPSSYITVIASGVFFILYFSGIIQQGRKIFLLLIATLFLVQPIEVLWHVKYNTPSKQFPYSLKPHSYLESKPQFSYLRPTIEEDKKTVYTRDFDDVHDRSGFPEKIYQYQATRWSFNLVKEESLKENLQEYVRHKFILYDPSQDVSLPFSKGQWITHDSDQFKVTAFDMNSIQITTRFDRDQVLVYNDSYYDGWLAYRNGHRIPIRLANGAFKSIDLPAGENCILFSFHTSFYRGFFLFLILYFQFVLLYLIFLFIRHKRHDAVYSSLS